MENDKCKMYTIIYWSFNFINGTHTFVIREHIWPKFKGFKNKNDEDTNKKDQPYSRTDMQNLYIGVPIKMDMEIFLLVM